MLCAVPALGFAQGRSILEVEPNDAAPSATIARLGDTISGTVNPDDVDYFAVTLEAGTQLELVAARVPFCRDFALLDPDGNRIAFGDCMDSIDTLRVTIPTAGRYLIRVTEFDDAPTVQPMRPYSLLISTQSDVGVSRVINALLAADSRTLDPVFARLLDQQGNGNGVLDVGDVRAYLRTQGRLPARVRQP